MSINEIVLIGALVLLLAILIVMMGLGRRYFRAAPSRGERQVADELTAMRKELQETKALIEKLQRGLAKDDGGEAP